MAHTVSNTKITAPESTSNVPSDRRVRDVADRIAYLDPNAAPLTLLTQKARSFSVYNTKYEWIEKDLEARWDQINDGAGYDDNDTTLTVDHGSYFSVGDLVKVPSTGEVFRVTSITGNDLTVTRGVAGTADDIADDADLLILSSAYAEGASSGSEKSHVEDYIYNYTQIIRTPFGVTGSENASENYTGNDRARLRAEKAIQHKIDIERTALFGVRDIDTTSADNPIRTTGGFLYYATENEADFSVGGLSLAGIETWCEDLFSHTASGDTRVVFMSPRVTSFVDQLAHNSIRLVPSDKTFGIAVRELITAHGTLMLVKHRLLTDGAGGAGYGGYMLGVDPQKFSYAYLRGRNTKLRMDIQSSDLDGFKDEYLTEFGWKLESPLVHGVAKGISALAT